MRTEITTAIESQVETIAAIYERAYRASVQAIRTAFIDQGKREPNSWDPIWGADVQAYRRFTKREGGIPSNPAVLDEAWLVEVAGRDAKACVANYAAKMVSKFDGLEGVEVGRMNAAGEFTITGTKAGRSVKIVQRLVFKTNSKGTRYVQWPALVWIDGRKSTEAAFKRLA